MAPEILRISWQLEKFHVVSASIPLVKARVETSFVLHPASGCRCWKTRNDRGLMTVGDGFSSKFFDHRNYNPPMKRAFYIDELPPHVAPFRPTSSPPRWELIREINGHGNDPPRSRNFRITLSRTLRSSEGKVWRRSLFLISLRDFECDFF